MAGCKSTLTGDDFYGPYDAQDNAKAHAAELGMDTVPSLNITYTEAGLCHTGLSDFIAHHPLCACCGTPQLCAHALVLVRCTELK